MATLYVERTRERRGLRLLLGLAIVGGFGLAMVALALAAHSLGQADNQDLARFAPMLTPAPIPLPIPPTAEQRLYPAATPAASALAAAKPQPEWVAVPTPPVMETTSTTLHEERPLNDPSIPDSFANAEGSGAVVPGGLIALTLFGLLAWAWLRREAKNEFQAADLQGRPMGHTQSKLEFAEVVEFWLKFPFVFVRAIIEARRM